VFTVRHIDALLGTSWRWEDEDEDAPAAHDLRLSLERMLEEMVSEISD
jgi:hypothetical protein